MRERDTTGDVHRIHHCYLDKKAVTRAAPTPTAAIASHEPPPFLASTVSAPILSELNLSGTLACRRERNDGKDNYRNAMNKSIMRFKEGNTLAYVCGNA